MLLFLYIIVSLIIGWLAGKYHYDKDSDETMEKEIFCFLMMIIFTLIWPLILLFFTLLYGSAALSRILFTGRLDGRKKSVKIRYDGRNERYQIWED